jgi:arylsulfatase A-like enzyme
MNNHIIKIIVLNILITGNLNCLRKEENYQKPNVVVIMTDDQGWGDLSVNGNTNIETPNIDILAKTGVHFDRFYVCPVCSPTRAEFLTGRYHVRGGVYSTSSGGERLDLDEETIAEIFKQAGYVTAAYGKWHNGMQPPYHPNARGFDDFYGFCSGGLPNYFSPVLEHNGKIEKGNGFIIDDLTDHGMNFIEKNQKNPFFLFMAFNTPHSPMQVPDIWWDKYKNKYLEMFNRDCDKEDIMFTKSALAMCENIDWNIGRLVNKIDLLGLSQNTLIIYLSDNGPNSWRWNDGMKGRKGSTDEGGVRSPLFLKWEGKFKPGKKIMEIVSVIDLLPTLVDLTGIEFQPKKKLDGVSLKPLLINNKSEWQERLIFNYWNGKTSVRNQKFRLDHAGQLFDMIDDPGQYTDISDRYPEITKDLLSAKDNWETDILIELPKTDPRPFTIGHPNYKYTEIPARDGVAYGHIIRSNRFPNYSFFTNWISEMDSIKWDVEVVAEGNFNVTIYYTCPYAGVGSTFELRFGNNKINSKIIKAHDPPIAGMENDRIPRIESYTKNFKPFKIGTIYLKKGKGALTLKANKIRGSQFIDFRRMVFERVN